MPALIPLKEWICDTCHQLIQQPEDGYVEWRKDRQTWEVHDFRIVHHYPASPLKEQDEDKVGEGCYTLDDMTAALEEFLGVQGLIRLLALIDVGPKHDPDFGGPGVANVREWTEFVRRVQLQHYEEARFYFKDRDFDQDYGDCNELLLYQPEILAEIANKYRENHLIVKIPIPAPKTLHIERMTEADMAGLLGSVDGDEDSHMLWVSKDGIVDLEPVGSRAPSAIARDMRDEMRFRWETFGRGSGDCGTKAALDAAHVARTLKRLRSDWAAGKTGYVDY